MNTQLKIEITNFMLNNAKEFQLLNRTKEEFRQYIYKPSGEYCIGGEVVAEFINSFEKLVQL
jgi:hypothetical protein